MNEKIKTTDKNSDVIMDIITDAPEVAETETTETQNSEKEELAPGVTLDPQNEEQLDLNLMKDPVAVSTISVPTDDDEGDFIEDPQAVKDLRAFIDENKSKTGDALKDPDLLKIGTEIASNFNDKLSFKESFTLALLAKNSILYGMSLNILKNAVKETGQNWIYYYKEHFIPSTYSSAIKYMKLARIPDIIRYSFLGLEKLEKINTAIKDDYDMKGPDPYGKFFSDSSISIDFHDRDLVNFKYDVDAAIAKIRIKNFFNDANKDLSEKEQIQNTLIANLIDDFIREDNKIETKLIDDLYLYAKDGDDPNEILRVKLKGNRGKTKENKKVLENLTDKNTIEGFASIISNLKSKVNYLIKRTDLIKRLPPNHMTDLEQQVATLKNLVNAQGTPKSK